MDRRNFLRAIGISIGSTMPGWSLGTTNQPIDHRLIVDQSKTIFELPSKVVVDCWTFNGSLPGPELRFQKGDRARIKVINRLSRATTVHWHGLRVPNAMDGVPHVTQPPIEPGQEYDYEFDLKDSGTFWYHPHSHSLEQVGRGLYGPLIVEETGWDEVDRDVTWVLGDFKIQPDGNHVPFGRISENAKSGRLGNIITINGKQIGKETMFQAASKERIRLRLINCATARVFALQFTQHSPWIIAYDGHSTTPHKTNDPIIIGPGMRTDIVLDFNGEIGAKVLVNDLVSKKTLAEVRLSQELDAVAHRDAPPMPLPKNDIPRADIKNAKSHYIEFAGGEQGPPIIGSVNGNRITYGEMKNKYGLAWTVAGYAAEEHAHHHDPLLVLKQGQSYVLQMVNKTGYVHPIHIHGHTFQVISINGKKPAHEEWRDTVYMEPWDEVSIAFVADNPGDWMFHCHILEHAASGMMGVIRVE